MAKIFLAVSYRNTHLRVVNRQNGSQRHNMDTANEFPENVAEFRCLGMRLTNQNCMNTCCHFVSNPLSFCVLSENTNFKTHKAIIFPI